jgi:hypothetical protein
MVAAALIVVLLAAYHPLKQWIYEYSVRCIMNAPEVIAAARFWSSRFKNPIDDDKIDRFERAFRLQISLSYLRHGTYPTIGVGELFLLSGEAADDVLLQAAADAGIVPRNRYGRDQLRQILPNGVIQFPSQSSPGIDQLFERTLRALRLPLPEDASAQPIFCTTEVRPHGSNEPDAPGTVRVIPFARPLPSRTA